MQHVTAAALKLYKKRVIVTVGMIDPIVVWLPAYSWTRRRVT